MTAGKTRSGVVWVGDDHRMARAKIAGEGRMGVVRNMARVKVSATGAAMGVVVVVDSAKHEKSS